jgi:hypothetical protein
LIAKPFAPIAAALAGLFLAPACVTPTAGARVSAPAELPPEPAPRESAQPLATFLPYEVGWRLEYRVAGELPRGAGAGLDARHVDERVIKGPDGSPLVERRLGPELPWDNLACLMEPNRRGCEDDVVQTPLRVGAQFKTPIGDTGRIALVDGETDTPAGHYAGCLVVDYTRPRAALTFARVYFAPGIGVVRIEWRRAPGNPEATRYWALERRVQDQGTPGPARRREPVPSTPSGSKRPRRERPPPPPPGGY